MAKKVIQKGSSQYKQNLAKQQFLNLNGIKVKLDGRWGPWQEQQYRRFTTKNKHYNVTPLGFLSYIADKIGGNTTYQEDPSIVSGYRGETKSDNRSNFGRTVDYLLQHNDNPVGYTYQTILPALAVSTTLVNPIVTTRAAVPGVLVGGTTSYTLDKFSKDTTGKTTEEWAEPVIGKEVSFLANPGTYIGGKTGYNYKNLGRFVMDNVLPASYNGHGKDFALAYAKALNPFSKVPRFFNRKPKWYHKGTAFTDQDIRFENMAQWAGVPEKEVPRVVTFDNGDGTRGFRRTLSTADILPDADKLEVGQKVTDTDFQFGVGGEHSDYTLKAKNEYGNLWLYEDEQKLNPQYILTDRVKDFFKIKKGSKPDKFIDYFAKKDLKGLLGFDHDIKYKQLIYENTKDGSVHLVQPF